MNLLSTLPPAARMDDVLDIVTWPVAVKGASTALAQEVRRCADLLVTAEVRVAFISERGRNRSRNRFAC